MGRPNCSIAVNGSWWRPTISLPKIRSDGDRSTGAAIAKVTMTASAVTAPTSAARALIRHHRDDDHQRTGKGPRPDIAHVRGETGVANDEMQPGEYRDLRQAEQREPCRERLPLQDGE